VRSGEIVLVTDRDEVVAELRPAHRQFGGADSLDELLDSLAERGELTRASLSKHRWKWNARGLGLAAGSAVIRCPVATIWICPRFCAPSWRAGQPGS